MKNIGYDWLDILCLLVVAFFAIVFVVIAWDKVMA